MIAGGIHVNGNQPEFFTNDPKKNALHLYNTENSIVMAQKILVDNYLVLFVAEELLITMDLYKMMVEIN